jgi:pimeloyl-ACP methyl ester carboxylesterase
MFVPSDDSQIFYEEQGSGPAVVLLHPFPASHKLWLPAAEHLNSRFHVVMPDLRGMGQSPAGEGPATMQKHATDILRVCDAAGVQRAVFAGCSVGGYILFELWRQARQRVRGLVFCDTKAGADTPEAHANRLKSARDAQTRGPEPFVDGMLPKLLGRSTLNNRPDIADRARAIMMESSAEGIAAMQRGMAERRDSTPTLATINVPALAIFGSEDVVTPVSEGEAIRSGIRGAELRVIDKAGHLALFEQADEAGRVLREWLERLPRDW